MTAPTPPAGQPWTAAPPYAPARPAPAAYGTVYAPAALLTFALTFTGIYGEDANDRWNGTSLWDMAGTIAGSPAVVGLVLVFALVGTLLAATFRTPRTIALPVSIAALTAVAVLMLWARPATGDPKPGFDDGGSMLMATGVFVLVTAVVHIVHLARRGTSGAGLPR